MEHAFSNFESYVDWDAAAFGSSDPQPQSAVLSFAGSPPSDSDGADDQAMLTPANSQFLLDLPTGQTLPTIKEASEHAPLFNSHVAPSLGSEHADVLAELTAMLRPGYDNSYSFQSQNGLGSGAPFLPPAAAGQVQPMTPATMAFASFPPAMTTAISPPALAQAHSFTSGSSISPSSTILSLPATPAHASLSTFGTPSVASSASPALTEAKKPRKTAAKPQRAMVQVGDPVQPRNYVSASATSRKTVIASAKKSIASGRAAAKRKRGQTEDGEDLETSLDYDGIVLTKEEEAKVEAKRRCNTEAARRSRNNKKQRQEALEARVVAVEAESAAYQARALAAEKELADIKARFGLA